MRKRKGLNHLKTVLLAHKKWYVLCIHSSRNRAKFYQQIRGETVASAETHVFTCMLVWSREYLGVVCSQHKQLHHRRLWCHSLALSKTHLSWDAPELFTPTRSMKRLLTLRRSSDPTRGPGPRSGEAQRSRSSNGEREEGVGRGVWGALTASLLTHDSHPGTV